MEIEDEIEKRDKARELVLDDDGDVVDRETVLQRLDEWYGIYHVENDRGETEIRHRSEKPAGQVIIDQNLPHWEVTIMAEESIHPDEWYDTTPAEYVDGYERFSDALDEQFEQQLEDIEEGEDDWPLEAHL